MKFSIYYSLISFCLLIFSFSFSAFSQTQIEQLEAKLTTAQKAEKPSIYNQLAKLYLSFDANKSLENAKEALSSSKENNDVSSEASSSINMGLANYTLGKHSQAILNYTYSLKVYETHKSKAGQGYCLVQIGLCNNKLNNNATALSSYSKAFDIYKTLNDHKGLSHASANMGDIYIKEKKIKKAVEKYKESIQYDKKTGDNLPMAHTYNKIGIAYSNFGNYENGITNLEKAYSIAKANNYSRLLADIARNISTVKKNRIDQKSAKTEYEKGEDTKVEEKVQRMEKESTQFEEKTSAFLTRISTLDEANKLNALELKVKEDDLKKQKMLLELANKEKDIKTAELEKTNAIVKQKEAIVKQKEAILKQQETQRNALIGGLVFVLVFVLLLFKGYRDKRKSNIQLAQHNKDITSHNEEISRQKGEIEVQRDQLESKNRQITDSIAYAKRIQNALLPPIIKIRKQFPESFVLFKPKDVVSGDFYWMKEKDEKILFAVADCTGHGVPGAFMSIISINVLNQCLSSCKTTDPGILLKKVNDEIINRLQQKHEEESSAITMKDGMDIALCCLDKKRMTLQFAGVHNPLYIIRNKELKEIRGENLFIGFRGKGGPEAALKTHEIKIEKEDRIYLFSDGFPDQKGGPNGKKFYYGPFKQMLIDIQGQKMNEQHEHIDKTISNWKGSYQQIDDILVMGIKI